MRRFIPIEDLFKGRHFEGQIIILCVAWYTSFKLSLRDLVIMMADRAAGEGPLQPVLEQPGGAGPSESEANESGHA
jgi:hypothetical protein